MTDAIPARRLLVVRGARDETDRRARALTSGLHAALLDGHDARALLGRSFDAVVIDGHDGIAPDLLGQAHGLVRGGGLLVVRQDDGAPAPRSALVVEPFARHDVGTRFATRLARCLDAHADDGDDAPTVPFAPRGTDEQARVIDALARTLGGDAPALIALTAPRGRGKSSALGLALARTDDARAVVTGPSARACEEVLRFAPRARFIDADALAHGELDDGALGMAPVVVVDEAAQLPLPLLRRLVARHPRARIALATTTHGYEGTGQGFVVRFLDELARDGRPLTRLSLTAPIRFAAGDPVERAVFDALLLDVALPALDERAPLSPPAVLSRDALASDERLLRSLAALLAHAHYKTTPSDLERLLDAPNLTVHAIVAGDVVAAACIVAREGGFSLDRARALARGESRVKGHALADTLVTHAAREDAGTLAMARSMRIATHPALRRRGLARALVEHVHQTHDDVALFGTLFGATEELVRFRRALGYRLVRVGLSRGGASGQPAAVMVRPVSAHARALVCDLELELARDLPHLAALTELDDALTCALGEGLPCAPPLDDEGVRARVARYLSGPQPFEAAAHAITRFVDENKAALDALDDEARALLVARVVEGRPWREVGRAHGGVARAMRALRPAIARLAALVDEARDGGHAPRAARREEGHP